MFGTKWGLLAGLMFAVSFVCVAVAQVRLDSVAYDSGEAFSGFFFLLRDEAVMATRFAVPFPDRESTLDRVYLAPYFLSQFADSGVPLDAPRVFTFYVWGPSGTDQPGAVLYSSEIADTRPFRQVTSLTIDFLGLDPVAIGLDAVALPDTFYFGFGHSAAVSNPVVAGASPYAVEAAGISGNVSYVLDEGAWVRLWDFFQTTFGVALEGVFPIRARFETPLLGVVSPEVLEVSIDDSTTRRQSAFSITNTSSDAQSYSVSSSANFLVFVPAQGSIAPAEVQEIDVSIDAVGLGSGTFEAAISVDLGEDSLSVRLTLTIASVTATEEAPSRIVALQAVYPNPVRDVGVVRLFTEVPQYLRVDVFDALGRSVARLHDGPAGFGEHQFHIDVSKLAAGLYFVRAGTLHGARTVPFVVLD